MSEKEFQTLTGVCAEIAQRPGSDWVEFHVDAGGKYPVRLSTKLQPLIELGRAVGQEIATWTYTEVESDKINEKSGKPYVNRYLEKVEVGASENSQPQATSPRTVTQGGNEGMSKEEWARKDSAIHKMACIKTAVEALKHTLPSDPSRDDIATFLERVALLSTGWHRSVIAERDDPTGSDIPFS